MNSQEFLKGRKGDGRPFDYLYEVSDFSRISRGAAVKLSGWRLEIVWQQKGIVRVIADREERFSPSSTPAVQCEQEPVEVRYREKEEGILLQGPELEVKVIRSPFRILFYGEEGELIHADMPGEALGRRRQEIRCCKELRSDERIYGLGEKTGFMDKRGRTYTMWNTDEARPHVPSTDPLYISVPFYIGFRPDYSYGIFFDNSYRSHFDVADSSPGQLIYTAEGGGLDYYFYGGPELSDVVERHTELTGRHPLPPLWSLGFHQSRYSYFPDSRVSEVAEKFADEDIPCDAIHLDIHYMDEYRVFAWDSQRFPDPGALAGDLSELGIDLITIMDPGVKKDPEYDVYREGIAGDYFCRFASGELYTGEVWPGESVFPDFTEPEVRKWWKELHEDYFEAGIRGIWNDMNEPADFNDRRTLPDEVMHGNDGDPGTHRRFHNLYALHEARATREAIREYRQERPFVLSRAGFAGIQRYSAVWTGDNRSFWQHLEMNVPMLANMGLSGIGFCGSDVGGFSDDCRGELLARWTQLGALMPFFRNHTCVGTKSQEPWAFGEPYTSINRRYIKLRYELLPHIYNLFYEMSQTGAPIWRPLVWHYPQDGSVQNINDQIMIGDNLLAAPVLRPDKRERRVYLPAGGWYDYWSGDYYRGGQSWIVEAPLERMPLFVRENSLIFTQPEPGTEAPEKGFEDLRIKLYPGRTGSEREGSLYLDDGISYSFQQGEYDLYRYSLESSSEDVRLAVEAEHAGFSHSPDRVEIAVAGLTSAPREIKIGEKSLSPGDYDLCEDELIFSFPLDHKARLILDLP